MLSSLETPKESFAVESSDAESAVPLADSNGWPRGHVVFDADGRITHLCNGLQGILELPASPALGDDIYAVLQATFDTDSSTRNAIKHWMATPNQTGKQFTFRTNVGDDIVQASVHPLTGQHWILTVEAVTAAFQANDTLYQDRLTGVGNRLLFEEKLDDALRRLAADEITSSSVFFLDLDRFKVVNDTLGHAIGDTLLRLVSARLQTGLQRRHLLARLGGDEFGILLDHGAGDDVATALATKLIDLVQRPYLIEGHVINIGVSIGIARSPSDGQFRNQLLKNADLALYHAKASGRGTFYFFAEQMAQRAQERRSLELDLRKALALRQFELHYQPQIDAETGVVKAFEALLRWQHPQRGVLQPEAFYPLAEELGLSVSIGNWVLKTACKEAARWPASVTLAINISPLQFEMATFAGSVEQALRSTGLPGARLEIEVTEDILLRDGETVRSILQALRELDVRVTMDSFGVGLASLSQLVNYPFDKIKLDKSLVNMQQNDRKGRAIVRAVSALGQSLGILTLAEGVETAEHLADVRSEGCQSMHGLYYAAAVPSAELMTVFSNLMTPPKHEKDAHEPAGLSDTVLQS